MLSPAEPHFTSAPAKIILFGEHAVVYGQPALAIPVSSLRVTVRITEDSQTSFVAGEWSRNVPADITRTLVTDPLLKLARSTADFLGVPLPRARFEIHSDIPVASGLGSGAAVSAALGRAVAAAAGRTLSDSDLNALVYDIETLHHGTPSGIDNTVIVYERPVYFLRGQAPQPFDILKPLTLLIADTGKQALTKDSVGDVRALVETDPAYAMPRIERIGHITDEARTALACGDIDLVGRLMNENHGLLRELTVSSPELENLVNSALHSHAIGAKLSGGGRGGNMIALVEPHFEDDVRTALAAAGAVRVISTVVA